MAGFTSEILKGISSFSKYLDDPRLVSTALKVGVPSLIAANLINLEPTSDVIGNYIKNQLVPGLEEYNMARETELGARKEMGTKQMPQLAKSFLETQQGSMYRQQKVQEAMLRKDSIVDSILKDPYLSNTEADKISSLVEDAIKIAPSIFSDNPSLALSVIRAAALSGADAIDPQTALSLTELEKKYTSV